MNSDKVIGALLIWVIWPGLTAELAAFSINSLEPHNPIWVTGLLSGFVFWWGIYLSIWLIGKGTP